MTNWCLASTGASTPWLALGSAILLIVAGVQLLRFARSRRSWMITGATLAALVAIAGLTLVPAPTLAASADGLGTACPTAAEAPATGVEVTLLNAATGLEAPVVILLGMDHLLDSENDLRLSEGERGDLRRDHTRMLYMGFTRAGQRLLVIRSGR